MANSAAHLVATCRSCGAPQPLTLVAPLGACEHCTDADPVGPETRERLDRLRVRLSGRDQASRQLTSKVLIAGDNLHGVGWITIVVCWLLFGGVATYISLDHDVAFATFVRGGEPGPQWWLLWSFALGLALSIALLELGVARVRGLSAQALPSPPIHEGAPPRCRCCAAELDSGTPLRRCGWCQTDNLVIGDRYLRAENNLDRALDGLAARFEQDLAARIETGGKIAMVGGVAPCFLLFAGIIGTFTPGRPMLWLVPGVTAVLAMALAVLARRRRLPIEAIELLTVGDKVGLGAPENSRRRVCGQLVLESGTVNLLGKKADKAEFGVATRRRDGTLHVTVYRVRPGTEPVSEQQRDRLVHTDLRDKARGGTVTLRRVRALTTSDSWRTFLDDDTTPHLHGTRISDPPDVWTY